MRLDHLLSKKMETVRIAFLSNRSLFREELMMSGGDACRGHTRSHPEHDGQDLRGRWYYVGDDMGEQVAAGLYYIFDPR